VILKPYYCCKEFIILFMKKAANLLSLAIFFLLVFFSNTVIAQIGKQFPSEKKMVKDPITGTMLTFLTSAPNGVAKIYQTHTQWTADGNWLVFRSSRAKNEALAVNETSGEIMQITEGGYTGMLCVARKSMKLYFMRNASKDTSIKRSQAMEVVEVDLEKLFNDSKSGTVQSA